MIHTLPTSFTILLRRPPHLKPATLISQSQTKASRPHIYSTPGTLVYYLHADTANMPLLLLVDIPRETRDHIHLYVFNSTNGSLGLCPRGTEARGGTILSLADIRGDTLRADDQWFDLSFLQTYKPIYGECKDLLWKHNKVCVWNRDMEIGISSPDAAIFTRIRHFEFSMELCRG